tara:strand:- start:13136 stop:13555 length:420 start_codon:yes stop_codon:yes gene_type:complete
MSFNLGVTMKKHPILMAKQEAKKLAKTSGIQLKQALKQIAFQNGFDDWSSYKKHIDTYWSPKGSPFLNQWFANLDQAKSYHMQNGGFLLTFKGQYFVTNAEYIEYIGFDPRDQVWQTVQYDLSSSESLKTFFKYYGKDK